jgi:hypothetical protein
LFNRLELVKIWYPQVYNKYMYNLQDKSLLIPFINSYIQVTNDEKYMNSYRERERERDQKLI